MRKSGGESAACAPEALPAPARDDAALCRAFLGDIGAPQPKALAVFSGRVIAPPADCPPLSGVRVLRVGLHLGASQSGRFVPDHALALGGAPQNTLPLSESDAARFLRGEELPVSDALQGWYAPAFCGFALGFGKASGGALKNHYPKGLRR